MKKMTRVLFILALALTCGSYCSMAQIYVKIRPDRPHYERTVAPSPRHVWIDEEWEPRGNAYVFSGGHWAEPDRPGRHWESGHWNESHEGHQWKQGHWRR